MRVEAFNKVPKREITDLIDQIVSEFPGLYGSMLGVPGNYRRGESIYNLLKKKTGSKKGAINAVLEGVSQCPSASQKFWPSQSTESSLGKIYISIANTRDQHEHSRSRRRGRLKPIDWVQKVFPQYRAIKAISDRPRAPCSVFLAHNADKLLCAIKLLKPEYSQEEEFFLRFQREIRAHVAHPNILQIIEANGRGFVAPYCSEGTLSDYVRKRGEKLDVSEALDIFSALADGIGAFHSKGIIHRDLKPSNILFDGDTPKIADFGLCKIDSRQNHNLSISGGFYGNERYAAPEQDPRNLMNVSIQSDVYSFGLILYECLTGHLPPRGRELSLNVDHQAQGKITELLKDILSSKPDDRPLMTEILAGLRNMQAKPQARSGRISVGHSSEKGTVVQGDTKPFKELLKRHGFSWHREGSFWYIRKSRGNEEPGIDFNSLIGELRKHGANVSRWHAPKRRTKFKKPATRRKKSKNLLLTTSARIRKELFKGIRRQIRNLKTDTSSSNYYVLKSGAAHLIRIKDFARHCRVSIRCPRYFDELVLECECCTAHGWGEPFNISVEDERSLEDAVQMFVGMWEGDESL